MGDLNKVIVTGGFRLTKQLKVNGGDNDDDDDDAADDDDDDDGGDDANGMTRPLGEVKV